MRVSHDLPLATAAWFIGSLAALGGCAGQRYSFQTAPAIQGESLPWVFDADHAQQLPMFAGHSGEAIDWSDLQEAIAWADVIIVGEEHDDAVGHVVELAIVQETLSYPRAALSMEMLERDEQAVVDDFLEGIVDAAMLEKLTLSSNWGGENKWGEWYQPMLDCAKDTGRAVIAANAPRRYVRLARTDGYDRLRALPAERRKLFDLPGRLQDEGYLERFIEVMESHDGAATQPEASPPADAVTQQHMPHPEAPRHPQAYVESVMGPQLVWDATMAGSIASAKRGGAKKVVHIVGQFHSDFNGGTVQELRRHLPRAKILTISMQRDESTALRDEDRNRADVLIYTGRRPVEQGPEEPAADAIEAPPQSTESPAVFQFSLKN
jgi:uncharacterized iron-regulated protein